jgi:imidazolonepropionase-like amidohydrolase
MTHAAALNGHFTRCRVTGDHRQFLEVWSLNRFASLLFLIFLPLATSTCFSSTTNLLALTHVTVVDVTGGTARSNLTVTIAGDRISSITSSAGFTPPTKAIIVDATGKFLIPGLWDMHVHWYYKEYLPLFVANGVTGIRMMLGMPMHHEWRKEIESGTLVGPRLLIASQILDGPKPFWPGTISVSNAMEARKAVDEAVQTGADFVKVYSFLPREAYFAIADEARKQKIPFAGHVTIAVSAEEASRAGQASIEHLTGILPACSSREAELLKSAQEALANILASSNRPVTDLIHHPEQTRLVLETYSPDKAAKLFSELKRNHTWQCPTLVVLRNVRYLDDATITNDWRLKYLSQELKTSWNPASDFRFKDRTAEETAVGKEAFQKEMEIVGAMQRADVPLLAGTDTPNPYCFPGFSLHDELALLVQAGLTPLQAIQSATINAARFMDREKDLGTVEVGKLADLVLLDADPFTDISNTRKINGVVCGGRWLSRSALDDMLARMESLANRPSTIEMLLATIEKQDVTAAIKQYRELKAGASDTYDLNEESLNTVGYRLIAQKRFTDAIRILQLNVEAYPKSSNVYDSLGEAYMIAGDTKLAIANYEKSLQLDPRNKNAVEKIKQLKGAHDK